MNFSIIALMGVFFLVACAAGSVPGPKKEIEKKRKALVGKWKKLSASECDRLYPAELEFRELATYLGKKGASQRFIIWDAGGYEVIDKDHIKLSIATDEQVVYRFSISDDTLTFVDDTSCEFKYRRLN